MKVTGLTSRTLGERDEVSFVFSGSVSNVTGSGIFAVSGESGANKFTFNAGKIYDSENKYFASYQSGVDFSISGNISGSKYNYYFNEHPVNFKGVQNNGKTQKFCLDASGCEINTEVRFKSKPFENVLSFPSTYTAGSPITGSLSGTEASHNFEVYSVDVTAPVDWNVISFDTGVRNPVSIVLANSGIGSGTAGVGYSVNLELSTNFGDLTKTINTTSFSSDPLAGQILSFTDVIDGGFVDTGVYSQYNSGAYNLDYVAFSSGEKKSPAQIKIDFTDLNTSGDIKGYRISGVQLKGKYKNGLYTGTPAVTFSSTGVKDVQATATPLMGQFMCADLLTGGTFDSSPLYDSGVKFYTITGLNLTSSGAYQDVTDVSITFSGGQYAGSNSVIGYKYNGPFSETKSDSNCTGSRAYRYSSGTYSNILDTHINIHPGAAVSLSESGNYFNRSFKDTWNILTGTYPTSDVSGKSISFNTGEPWKTLINTITGTQISRIDKTSGDGYSDTISTSEDFIKIDIWNRGAYKNITDASARIIENDKYYTYNYSPLTIDNRLSEAQPTGLKAQDNHLTYTPWGDIKDLATGTLATGGQGTVNFRYSFIGTGTRDSHFQSNFSRVEETTGNTVTFSQFTGEIVDSFAEWKGLLETVFTGLTVNFINKGEETGSVPWDMHGSTNSYNIPHPTDSIIGDVRIGRSNFINGYNVGNTFIEQQSTYFSQMLSTFFPYNSGCVLNQSGNYGGDIILTEGKTFRLDSQSVSDAFSIKYIMCQQIGRMLGVTLSDHMDSILFSPKDGTADIYANYNFSTLFPNGLSGSRPDQDLVLYSFLGDKEQSSLTANKAKAEAASTDLFSGTLTISGETNQTLTQVITGGLS